MKKDAYWFPHDSNAKDDPKCTLMIDRKGPEYYGIFWILVEICREQPEFKYPIALIPSIARKYNTTVDKVRETIFDYGLFDMDGDDFFFSHSLVQRMIPLQEKKEQARIAGILSAQKRKERLLQLQQFVEIETTDVELTLNGCSTDVERTLNISSTIREENSIEDNIIEEKKAKKSPPISYFSDEIKDFTGSLSKYFSNHITDKLDKTEKWRWVDTIDKLVRLDNYKKDEIRKAVELATQHEFWQKNFLSLTKLRKKNDDGVKYINVFLQLDNKPVEKDITDEVMKIYTEKYASQ